MNEHERICVHCGFTGFYREIIPGFTCDLCRRYVSADAPQMPPEFRIIRVDSDSVPASFIARSDYQPGGVPVKIVEISTDF